jgi:hypothetical protein
LNENGKLATVEINAEQWYGEEDMIMMNREYTSIKRMLGDGRELEEVVPLEEQICQHDNDVKWDKSKPENKWRGVAYNCKAVWKRPNGYVE